ncbi:MAG TPA: EAL domain-containing protein [Rhodanobacteraceae bacterium]|nr:EAL domain-containing protein [Rhodanobacteraceae bacterium]
MNADPPPPAASPASPPPNEPIDPARIEHTLNALQSLHDKAVSTPGRRVLTEVIHVLRGLLGDNEANLARYRTLINAVPDAVTLHDENGRILDANDAAEKIYGYPLATLRTLSVSDLNPNLAPNHLQQLWIDFQPGHTVTDETLNRHADGSSFPIEVHSNAYLDNGQRRIIAVARDISERRHVEAELRASEARYIQLLGAMDKGVLVQDERGFIVSANPAACRLLGMDEQALKQISRTDLGNWNFVDDSGHELADRDLPGIRALITGLAIDSTLVGVYIPHLHAYRWLSVSSVPDVDPASGRTRQVISTFSDVSALKREAEMFRATQKLGEIGCWELDDLRGTLFWTEHMYRVHDLPPDRPITEARALSFMTVDSRAALVAALGEARLHGTRFELELELNTAIGRHRWVSLRGQPLQRHGRIYGVIGTLQNIDGRKAIEDQLRRQACIDPVTNLANRDAILAVLDDALGRADDANGTALLYVDPDRFKVLNDMLGHRVGDRLLFEAAQRLQECVNGEAVIGRYGNDEFLLVIERRRHASQADALARRVVEAFTRPFEHEGERFALTVSVGVAESPVDGGSSQTLLLHADAAMREAKRRGRNTWRSWRGSHEADGGEEQQLLAVSQLRLALDNDEFHLVYQPQVRLSDGKVCGMEALLRWHSPTLGAQLPAAFIPLAESTGDIVRIGAWVIDEACRQLRHWRDHGLAIERMAVNVSYRQVLSGKLVETVAKALRDYALPGSALELEMTERVLIENVSDAQETFQALKHLGVMLVIDDFGEGYSSLNYLRNLPLDGIKISHSFMHGIPANNTDAAICEAIVRIARSLGLRLVAEGVETEAQREFLLALGTGMAQGYLFARPQLASDIPATLARLNQTFKPTALRT